ncbi:hypothetical protein CesoFtcFv8_018970 [Champsocephalus esox]|uniref:Activating transcription factor 7-interacting protein Fn3 domain-containing protein n=1 Tax=Champsocephalus esox TaxID=159716 RepID=A0AAN8BIS3_9TELE|nr:hypothetical protein CesoFtcFv8_018970 [Champsocephalus esox]
MADAEEQTLRKRSRADQKTFKPSPKQESPSLCSPKQTKLAGDARVNIGSAFETWREVKASKGLQSDVELGLTLLDKRRMKRLSSDSSGPSDKRIKLSQSEVQTLIEQEVQTALKKRENKLLGLLGTIQELDESLNYKSSIQKLEERMNTVTRRAEAAIAFMTKTQKENPQPSLDDVEIKRADSSKDKMKIPPNVKSGIKSMEKKVQFLNLMKNSKTALTKMQEDNESLKAVIAGLTEKLPPPVPTPNGSSDCKGTHIFIKKETDHEAEKRPTVEDSKQSFELKAVKVKVEHLSSDHSSSPNQTNAKQGTLLYPPLPPTPFPSILSIEVASYNLPGRPIVNVALIKKPVGLSVLWNVEDIDPQDPPMDSYSLFMTMEKVKGSGVFPSWASLGEISAGPLPMCAMISKYKLGHTMCVVVIGKDKFGRYGPYSEIVNALIPE